MLRQRRVSSPFLHRKDGFLVNEDPDQETVFAEEEELTVRRDLMAEAMKSLNQREQEILTERRLQDEPKTLEDLSQVYKISRERVRQIEVRAFEKLQKAMLALSKDRGFVTAEAG